MLFWGRKKTSIVLYSRQANLAHMSTPTAVHADIERAVAILREGGVVAFPTDTLYALAADATNPAAVARVFDIKGREGAKPLPLFVADREAAERIGVLTTLARRLATNFWPGALTLVVRRQPNFQSDALAGGDTIALRAPDHPIALAILAGIGRPLTGTSANLSGGADPVDHMEVARQLGEMVDFVVAGGACKIGVSSTIVDCAGERPRILREGAVPHEAIESALAS